MMHRKLDFTMFHHTILDECLGSGLPLCGIAADPEHPIAQAEDRVAQEAREICENQEALDQEALNQSHLERQPEQPVVYAT